MTRAHPVQATTSPKARCLHCGEDHPLSFAHCPKTGKDITAGKALVGRVIGGRYRVAGLLGRGGMGAVYVAEHTGTGRKVAIKRLHPELAGDEKSVLRFQREARAAGATGHDHIVEIIDLGMAEDGAPFLVMEYLEGENLAEVLQREGRLPPHRACHILAQALDALAAVHEEGVVHRDLKPDNLFLTRRAGRPDYVKVLDFGISKVRKEGAEAFEPTLTRTGAIVGTPYYMSPEQARGASDYDHRVDLYGAGVILYQCLSGQLPFDAANYHALLQAILRCQPVPLGEVAPDVPPPLCSIVHRAMAADPSLRFASADALRQALIPYGGTAPVERPQSGRQPRVPAAAISPSKATEPGHVPPPRSWAQRPRPFEASSKDWDEQRGALLSLAARPPATSAPPLPHDTHAPTRVRSVLLTAALDHIRNGHGEAARVAVVNQLGPSTAAAITPAPPTWLPLESYDQVLRAAERTIGSGDGATAADLGAATAARELPVTHLPIIQNATPLSAIGHISRIFASYHRGGRVQVEPGTGGSYRLTVVDVFPDTFLHAMAMTGFYRSLLALAGAADPRVWLMSSRARGDAQTTIVVRWR
jgi:serine/threonine protein kinase